MARHNGTQDAPTQVNIQEAGRLLHKSEKTLRRWVHQEKLHPVMVEGKFLFDLDELKALMETTPTLEERMTAVEQRVTALERKLEALSSSPASKPRPMSVVPHKAERPATPLPDGLIALSEMVKRHHVPETSVRRAVENGALPVVRGSWPGGVKQAIDAEGHAKFYDLYHERAGFERCPQCPHA